ATNREDCAGILTGLQIGLDDVVGGVGNAFKERAKNVAARMRQVETKENALGERVVYRRGVAREVGKKHQSLGAGWRRHGLVYQLRHGRLRIEVAGQYVTEPM